MRTILANPTNKKEFLEELITKVKNAGRQLLTPCGLRRPVAH